MRHARRGTLETALPRAGFDLDSSTLFLRSETIIGQILAIQCMPRDRRVAFSKCSKTVANATHRGLARISPWRMMAEIGGLELVRKRESFMQPVVDVESIIRERGAI
jgi:hypothetical protein